MRRAALALLIGFSGTSAGARADDTRITIKASWHLERVLTKTYDVERRSMIAAQLGDVEASLTKKIDANELPSALAPLRDARGTLNRLSEPRTDMSSVSASKQIVSARRSILRGIANLSAWWTAAKPASAR